MRFKKVTAFKYNGRLFESKEDVLEHIRECNEQKRMKSEIDRLDNPISFKIKEGYFDFFVFNGDSRFGEDYKRICYKTKKFDTAVKRVMKRLDCGGLDYEAEILDKNKMGTGIFIDMCKMPDNHEVHSYIH